MTYYSWFVGGAFFIFAIGPIAAATGGAPEKILKAAAISAIIAATFFMVMVTWGPK